MIVAPVRVVVPKELTVTAPPAPPAKPVVDAAALPTAVTAPKLTAPPVEFSVTLPAARPTPVEVPPLVFNPTPDTLMSAAAVTLTFPPAASLAPLVIMFPATLIVPAPALVMSTFPEAIPAAAVVVMSCPAARSTPPVPPVSVTAPPAVVIPAFKSNVVPTRVTLVVAPVAAMAPSTCTSPPAPLERIITGALKVDVSTVINPV